MNDPLPQVGTEDISNDTGRKETSCSIDSHARKELKKFIKVCEPTASYSW